MRTKADTALAAARPDGAAATKATWLAWAVGLSSIGGRLRPVGADEPAGLYLELGPGPTVRAVLAPGLTADVQVRESRLLALGDEVVMDSPGGTVALDGERELQANGPLPVRLTANGPLLVDVRRALAMAGQRP